jgi:hypothetical protein
VEGAFEDVAQTAFDVEVVWVGVFFFLFVDGGREEGWRSVLGRAETFAAES